MDARLPDALESVTERQREVARLIAEGKTNPQIAEALGITLDGAKYHVSELLGRLGLERREEVADWYRRQHGWRSRLRGLFTLPLGALIVGGTVVTVTVIAVVAVIVVTNRDETTGRLRAPGTIEEVDAPPGAYQQSALIALPDGSALLLGGWSGTPLEKSDRVWRFDPRTNHWTDAGTLAAPLVGHVVATTPNGIMVAGGRTPSVSALATPLDNSVPRVYRITRGALEGSDALPVVGSIAALSPRADGSVDALLETRGGEAAASFHVRHWTGAIWEPITGPPYEVDDRFPQAVTLTDGSFAVVTTTQVAVIDPIAGSYIELTLPQDSGIGTFPTVIGLRDSRIVLLGGVDPVQWGEFADATTEWMAAVNALPAGDPTPEAPVPRADTMDGVVVIDPATHAVTQYRLPSPRALIAASLLPGGRIFLAGGVPSMQGGWYPPGPMWTFDPARGTFEELPAIEVMPPAGSTVTLADGRVLLLGTFADPDGAPRTRAYLYQP